MKHIFLFLQFFSSYSIETSKFLSLTYIITWLLSGVEKRILKFQCCMSWEIAKRKNMRYVYWQICQISQQQVVKIMSKLNAEKYIIIYRYWHQNSHSNVFKQYFIASVMKQLLYFEELWFTLSKPRWGVISSIIIPFIQQA